MLPPAPRPRRWASLVATAALAAAVSGGTTLAVVHNTAPTSTSVAAAAAPVVQPAVIDGTTTWAAVAAKASPSVVAITVTGRTGEGQGSGVIWDDQGHIVTNNHVVSGLGTGATIQVQLGAQQSYAATVVGTDPTTDLAVIKLTNPPSGLTPIARAQAGAARVGDPVMALGNPLGLSGTVTTGIISAVNRPMTTQQVTNGGRPVSASAAQAVVTDAIQTSAAINPGNSGGALVDANGALVGINSAIASLSSSTSSESGNIGIGFAIPVGEVENVVTQLMSTGRVDHATLGIGVTDASATQGSATLAGAGVSTVQSGSGADKAGLRKGDVITALNGGPITSAESLIGRIRSLKVGQQVTLTVVRDGQTVSLTATLGSQPTS